MSSNEDFKAQRRELMRFTPLTWIALGVALACLITFFVTPYDSARDAILLVVLAAAMIVYLVDRLRHFRRVRRAWDEADRG